MKSFAVTGVPSLNLPSDFNLKVHTVASALGDQDSAAAPTSLPLWSISVRLSNTAETTLIPSDSKAFFGSMNDGSAM